MTYPSRTFNVAVLTITALTSATAQAIDHRGCAPPVAEAALGLTTIECLQCSLHSSGADRWMEYGAEPVVRRVSRPSGPVLPGDVLVAIDGRLITTAAGGLRLAHVDLFRPTVLSVRRGGRRMDLTVTPISGCAFSLALDSQVKMIIRGMTQMSARFDTAAKPGFTVTLTSPGHFKLVSPGNPYSDTLQFHFERDTITWKELQPFTRNGDTLRWSMHGATMFGPDGQGVIVTDSAGGSFVTGASEGAGARGWTGFTIFCYACTVDSTNKNRMQLHFSKSPQIAGVDRGSAAEAAGLRYSVRIKEIDGLDLMTPAGAQRFNSLQPGQKVRFTIESGYPTKRAEVVMTLPPVH